MYLSWMCREGDAAQISQPGRGLKASSGGPFLVVFLTAAILGRSLQSRGARGGDSVLAASLGKPKRTPMLEGPNSCLC